MVESGKNIGMIAGASVIFLGLIVMFIQPLYYRYNARQEGMSGGRSRNNRLKNIKNTRRNY